ncbi:MAG: hypothetical protein ABIJ56_17000 [Pseudomonadota bacterium]
MAGNYDEPPAEAGPEAEILGRIAGTGRSSYFEYLRILENVVAGRKVLKATAGGNGFVLVLDNGTWVAAYPGSDRLEWKSGRSPGDKHPSRPGGACDSSPALHKAEGKRITGIVYGKNTFSFCFPYGCELRVSMNGDGNGGHAVAVFWEQM